MIKHFVRSVLAATGAVVLLLCAAPAHAAIINPITGIGSVVTSAAGINDNGVVAGLYFTNFDGPFGFRYTAGGGMEALPLPPGFSSRYEISNRGSRGRKSTGIASMSTLKPASRNA